mgnify:CR=1 FL=1
MLIGEKIVVHLCHISVLTAVMYLVFRAQAHKMNKSVCSSELIMELYQLLMLPFAAFIIGGIAIAYTAYKQSKKVNNT